jgi:chromate transporter
MQNSLAVLHPSLTALDLLGLFAHFMVLSLLAVGGAITTAPGLHRYIVGQHGGLTDGQFTAAIAIAQSSPGPNVMFVAVLGWNLAGPLGVVATMVGMLLPSTALSIWATRWGAQRRETRGVRAFTGGLTPITLGLLLATSWILAEPYLLAPAHRPGALALMAITIVVMAKTRWSLMWLIALGALVGALGWV